MRDRAERSLAVLSTVLLLSACSGASTVTQSSPSAIAGALTNGLIAYVADAGIGVLDPSTGKSSILAPLPEGGAFRTSGPVWGPSPDTSYPVIYFSVHDDRPAERRTSPGVVPYDWLFRVDPFTGVTQPLAASADFSSEGPLGMAANARFLAFTTGCCSDYEVDALDLTAKLGPLKVLSKPPDQAPFFIEGAKPGVDGLLIVRAFAGGGWYYLNPDAAVLNPFPLALGPDDGPVDISRDGKLAAVSPPDQGPVVYAMPQAAPAPATSGSPAQTVTPPPQSPASPPRHINSKLPHADDLAWSPDQTGLVFAVGGHLEVYDAKAADGASAQATYLDGANVSGVDWSDPMPDRTAAMIKAGTGPQAAVDRLLDETKLPPGADTPQGRPATKVYIWTYDASKPGASTSPVATVTDPTGSFLAANPPDVATVDFDHWSAVGTWPMLGGCWRYRVIVTGSVSPPVASTIALDPSAVCNA